jgi:hypothetical protein
VVLSGGDPVSCAIPEGESRIEIAAATHVALELD